MCSTWGKNLSSGFLSFNVLFSTLENSRVYVSCLLHGQNKWGKKWPINNNERASPHQMSSLASSSYFSLFYSFLTFTPLIQHNFSFFIFFFSSLPANGLELCRNHSFIQINALCPYLSSSILFPLDFIHFEWKIMKFLCEWHKPYHLSGVQI